MLGGIAVLLACLFGAWQFWSSIASRKVKILFIAVMILISVITIVLMFMEEPGDIFSFLKKNKERIDVHQISFEIPSGWKRVDSKEYAVTLIPRKSSLGLANEHINVEYIDEEDKMKGKTEGEKLIEYSGEIENLILESEKGEKVIKREYYTIRTSNLKGSGEDPLYNENIAGIGGSAIVTYDKKIKKYKYKVFFLNKDIVYKINASANISQSSADETSKKIDDINSGISEIAESISIKSD